MVGKPRRIEPHRQPGTVAPVQLSLALSKPHPAHPERAVTRVLPIADRVALPDLRMTTAEVLRVVGVHRTTLFRWMRKGAFPPRHHSGGWLRSDIEHWLSRRSE